MLHRTPAWFPNALPVHCGGRREMHHSHSRTDGQMTGVTNRTAVIVRVPVFVDCGGGLQAHKAGKQQRYQERPSQAAGCEYTNHARLFDDSGVPSVAECWGDAGKK